MKTAVCFSNGIGNFILATPFLQNLDNPEIFSVSGDARTDAIRDISPWPVTSIASTEGLAAQFEKCFVLWCWPTQKFPVNGKNVIHQSSPDWKTGAHETKTYLELLPKFIRFPPMIKTKRKWTLRRAESQKLIALCNGGAKGWDVKRWPVNKWVELGEALVRSHNVQLVFVGDAADSHCGKAIINSVGSKCWNFAGLLSFAESADLLAQCDLVICNDTGLLHAADAVTTRIVALFGPTLLSKNAPRANSVIIQGQSGGCAHFPCIHNRTILSQCKHSACMDTISVERVLSSIDIWEDFI